MKARNIMIAAAFAALAILSAGCKKHSWRPEPGTQIRFRAESDASGKAADTKTVYSGEYYKINSDDENPYERIDWVEGDRISIGYVSYGGADGLCAKYDHYRIDSASEDGYKSKATLLPTGGPYGGNGLQWTNNTYHRFFATYPAVDASDSDFWFKITDNDLDVQVPYNYPETQVPVATEDKTITFCGEEATAALYKPDMSYAYLFSNPYDSYGSDAILPTGGTINLPFVPHFTAFEVTAAAKEGESFPLNSITISSRDSDRPLTGTYLFKHMGDDRWEDVPKEGATSQKATVNFEGLTLTDSRPVIATFIVRGWNSLTKLVLTFNIVKDGKNVNRSIRLTGDQYNNGSFDSESGWYWFNSQTKHRITNLRVPLEANAVWFEGVSAGEFENVDLDF